MHSEKNLINNFILSILVIVTGFPVFKISVLIKNTSYIPMLMRLVSSNKEQNNIIFRF
jgi:hypothetical protein